MSRFWDLGYPVSSVPMRFLMKPALSAAFFSAVFSAVVAPVYFWTYFAIQLHGINLFGLLLIGGIAIPISGFYGFILGLLGGCVLPRLPFLKTTYRFVVAACFLGGVMGCTPALITKLSTANLGPGERLGFAPCVLIGILSAGSWSLYWLRHHPVRQSQRT